MSMEKSGREHGQKTAGGNGLQTIADPAAFARSMYDLWNKRDFDRMMPSISRDVNWVNVPLNRTFHGQDGYRQYVTGWANAFPDARIEVKNVIATENAITAEFVGRGTHTGSLEGPQGTIPPTNKRMELQFVEIWELRGGEVVGGRLYFDAMSMMRQLGLVPGQSSKH